MRGPANSVLPDVLQPELDVVFCGTASGKASAFRRAYYAGHGNRFWEILQQVGLTDRLLGPDEYMLLLQYRIGLTDISKTAAGMDNSIDTSSFDVGGLRDKILSYKPRFLGLNGIKAARLLFEKPVNYGVQSQQLGGTTVYVLPSTSGAARRYWNERHWVELATVIKAARC